MSIAQSVKHQDRLLTINIKDGEIKNALPGVHVTPCFLDPDLCTRQISQNPYPIRVLPS
ncbi:hypothetical protein [Acinetobacter johnsonii]|uniref:hypothetical protein n=1 Tax=Acinetobacter johnsonii TaxID=40214 RepID=UPI0032B43A02